MKKSFKKYTSLLLVLLLLTVLAACNSDSSSGENNQGGNDNQSSEGTEEKVSFTIMANLHTPEVPDEKIEKLLEEATGVDLTIQWTPDSTYEEKLNTAFATETLPEATYLKNQSSFIKFKEAMRDDQFWEIGPYLDEFPNLKNLKEQTLKNTSVDGKIYTLYVGRPYSRQGLIYRKDWADNLGLGTPETIEDIFEMARAFTEDDPDGNGVDDTFGLTDRSDLVYGAFKTITSWFGTPNNWGEKDGELLPEFMFEEYYQAMDFMKELRDNGYMNQDFAVTSKEDQQAFIKNGTAGMYIGSIGDVQSIYNDAVQINPDVEFDVVNKIVGPHGEFGVWALPGYGNVLIFPKSSVKSEEQLKGILGFFDYLMTPEGANLIYWGVEGEHYQVIDGKAEFIVDNTVTDREVKAYQALEIGEPSTNGRYEGLFTYDVKAKAEELILDNENYLIHDPTNALDSPTYNERGLELNQIIADATVQYIIGDIDRAGFEEAVQRWLNSGGQDAIDEYNESYKNSQ